MMFHLQHHDNRDITHYSISGIYTDLIYTVGVEHSNVDLADNYVSYIASEIKTISLTG